MQTLSTINHPRVAVGGRIINKVWNYMIEDRKGVLAKRTSLLGTYLVLLTFERNAFRAVKRG